MTHRTRLSYSLFVTAMLVVFAWPAAGQDSLEVSELSHWYNGPCRVVRLLDGLVYVGNGAALDIADVSEGGPPMALGKVALTAPAQDLSVLGDLALVAMGEFGLAVVDVSESDEPVVIGTFLETDADVRGVAAGVGYAYLADIALGLRIVDLSDPTAPVLDAEYDPNDELSSVIRRDSLLYVAD